VSLPPSLYPLLALLQKRAKKSPLRPRLHTQPLRVKAGLRTQNAQKASGFTVAKRSHASVAKSVAGSDDVDKEDVLLDAGLRVESIYPQSGKYVQAWIRDGAGKLRVVHEDETIFGVMIEKIDTKNLTVALSDGRAIGPGGIIEAKPRPSPGNKKRHRRQDVKVAAKN